MNQEKIGKFIKEIRLKENLSQQKFADKYGVTYQAVSKWENGKNIPDIAILKQICEEYKIDLNDLLDGETKKNIDNKRKLIIGCLIIIFIMTGICLFLICKKDNNDFHFKKLSTNCENFTLYGTIAYNSNKTSIYISNISYCGEADTNEYKEIECTLYEYGKNTKTKINSYSYKSLEPISLEKFLEQVDFSVEHHSTSCKMYQENTLYLEIEATSIHNQTTFYKIPLQLEETCSE